MELSLDAKPVLEQRQEGRTVLVVDDEAVIRELCVKTLKRYRVIQANNGEEALELLGREKVDIVLTDVMMPHLNGLDLLKQIKDKRPSLPVVVMTGNADRDMILRALKADADDFISKPLNLLQLRTIIDNALEKTLLKEELIQLQQMDRLKTDFLGLVSHKLKTPVTAISLFIQNLARGVGNPDDPNFQRHLQMMVDESSYLVYLIQDLLYYSEVILQDGQTETREVDLHDLVKAVTIEAAKELESRGITLVNTITDGHPPVLIDRRRVRFAIQALFDNAVKFTPAGGTITISAVVEDGTYRLAIADTGPGIEETELPKVFEKFYQVDPQHTGQVRGFGLGLFYARLFAQAQGGTVRLESSPGVGTTAWLNLPC